MLLEHLVPFLENTSPKINGDGETSRDFTFFENAVQANIRTLQFGVNNLKTSGTEEFSADELRCHEVFNTACGDQVTLNEMIQILQKVSGKNLQLVYGPVRTGDVKHSKASIYKISKTLGYMPKFRFKEGLDIALKWYNSQQ